MEHIEFGTRERALLLTLMTLGGSASNPELKEHLKDTLDGEPRRRMNELGLVTSVKQRAFHHELTEAGWAWCVGELSASAPSRAGSLGRSLYCVLPMIRDFLNRADISLAEFAVARGVVPPASSEGEVAPVHGSRDADEADLETRIRGAYWSLAKAPQDWVLLTAVRSLLGNAPRAEVDAVLKRMERLSDVHIAPEADQKTLTETDREAAVRIGGTSKHLLSIEAR